MTEEVKYEQDAQAAPEVHGSQRPADLLLTGGQSPGVRRIEAISAHLTLFDRVFLFIGVFLIAYAYGLDGTLRYAYQPTATASYGTHSLLATIAVTRAVIAAAAQPTAAKIADVFGRVELVLVSIFFYVIGTIVEASSHGVSAFCAGAVLYQIGYTCIILLVEVIIGDLTSTRSRLFFSYIPAAPFIINTWVSGDVSAAVLTGSTWQWGIGMWAIIYPVCAIPLLVALYIGHWRAKKAMDMSEYKTPFQILGGKKLAIALFWQLDVIGIVLLIAVFGLILVPLTLAGDHPDDWRKAKIIAPLIIGALCIPVWITWERRAPYPLIPFKLLKDRAVWGALGLAIGYNFAWTMQGDFLYSVLQVGFGESVKSATRIASLFSFTSVLTGIFVGIVVIFVKRHKPFIIAGTCLYMVAFGLLIQYRGSGNGNSHAGIVGAQVTLGLAGGLFPYVAQASIQVATKHEHLAVVTGLYLASYNIGSALGNSISGVIWNTNLPRQLEQRLAFTGNETLAATIYGDPFTFIASYPIGTPERDAVVGAYGYAQRLLCITGICLCVPLIGFALVLRNPKLGKTQSLPEFEKGSVHSGESAENVREPKI